MLCMLCKCSRPLVSQSIPWGCGYQEPKETSCLGQEHPSGRAHALLQHGNDGKKGKAQTEACLIALFVTDVNWSQKGKTVLRMRNPRAPQEKES